MGDEGKASETGAGAIYARSLRLLAAERGQAVLLAVAGMAVAVVQLAEPILFGRVIDALAAGRAAFRDIGIWAALGLFDIGASVVVAVAADRLAHRRRLAAMGEAFERAITLPVSYHARRGTGAVVRTILAGTDALFAAWLSFLRSQLTAVVSILILIPTALRMDARMAAILGLLAVLYVAINALVLRRTRAGPSVAASRSQASRSPGERAGGVGMTGAAGAFAAAEVVSIRSSRALPVGRRSRRRSAP